MSESELAKLYTRYGYVVFRRCLAYLGDPEAAQRAVEDVFLRVVRGWEAFSTQPEPHRWLCRCADELCLAELRRNRADTGADHAHDIEVAIANDDAAALASMRKLVRELDPETFRLAVLYFMDELTEAELAQELGVSRRKVAKREQLLLQRARQLLEAESVT